jgi:hypothetical protein
MYFQFYSAILISSGGVISFSPGRGAVKRPIFLSPLSAFTSSAFCSSSNNFFSSSNNFFSSSYIKLAAVNALPYFSKTCICLIECKFWSIYKSDYANSDTPSRGFSSKRFMILLSWEAIPAKVLDKLRRYLGWT